MKGFDGKDDAYNRAEDAKTTRKTLCKPYMQMYLKERWPSPRICSAARRTPPHSPNFLAECHPPPAFGLETSGCHTSELQVAVSGIAADSLPGTGQKVLLKFHF